jgi:hypothetical protein
MTNRSYPSASRLIAGVRTAGLFFIGLGCAAVQAQNLVAYYQIGLSDAPWAKWDTYVIDATSVIAQGEHIRYKSFRITAAGSDEMAEVRAECSSRKRGLVRDASMYSTYEGTLSGEEVRVACDLFQKKSSRP